MAIAPGKLKALVDQHAANPAAALGMKKAAPSGHMGMDDEDGLDEEAKTAVDPAERGAEILGEMGEFGAALKENADLLMENASEVPGVEKGPAGGEVVEEAVEDSVERMPDDIQSGLAEYVAPLSPEDCAALATALTGGEAPALAGYLACAGKAAAAMHGAPAVDAEAAPAKKPAGPPAAPPAPAA